MSERDFPLPPELEGLSAVIDSRTECLAGASSELRTITLRAAKHVFDWALETEKSSKPHLETLLATLSETAPPQTRSRARSSSRQWRSPSPIQKPKIVIQETPLSSLFIDGMNTDQIWHQLDMRAARICENLQVLHGEDEDADMEGAESDNDESEEEVEEDVEEMDIDDESRWEEFSDGEEDDSSIAEEGVVDLQEEISEDDEDHGPPTSMLDVVSGKRGIMNPPRSHSQGHSEIDDGFFDLAAFNAETSGAEAKGASNGKLAIVVTGEDSGDESEVDLFGRVDDSEPDGQGVGGGGGELFYRDFFDAPPQTRNRSTSSSKVRFHERVSVKKIKAVGKGMPVSSVGEEDSDEEEIIHNN